METNRLILDVLESIHCVVQGSVMFRKQRERIGKRVNAA